ncbi:MAG: hypothetical protein K9K32_05845, partial [Halanaerobiales bacterium]|nr:hypothetical protein [Halanaerobiales bacterium]
DLIDYLKESDFFTAPASANHHLNCKGGLALHSWHVYENYCRLHKRYQIITPGPFPFKSVVIESLLHDVCKIDRYKIDDEPASKKQLNYLESLIRKNITSITKRGLENKLCNWFNFDVGRLNKNFIEKSYCSSLIDWLKNRPDEDPPEKEENWTYKDDNLPLGHGEKSVSIIQDFIELKDREKLAIRYHMGAWEDGVLNGGKNRGFNRARELYPDVQLLQMADYEATFYESYL